MTLDALKKPGSWLTIAEMKPSSLNKAASLARAVELFQADTDLRLLPVLDDAERPVGAIFEKDIRRLLLNPFGHALLRNPSFGAHLHQHLRACPVHEVTDEVGDLIDYYRRSDGREGMVLTMRGRLFATITNRRLLMLAAEREHRNSIERLARANRIETAGRGFESEAAMLAAKMIQLSNGVQRLAEATVDRATIAGNRAASVAAAAVQTRAMMSQIAGRGDSLANAFVDIENSLSASRDTAKVTVERVTDGRGRARALLDAAKSIDSVMELVAGIASTVNLLSLNASIEAARAGEAGLGFSVVANEIRSLSEQTHAATETIASEVENLKNGVRAMANDYGEIETAIGTMLHSAGEIDSAISGEAASTRLIAHSVAEASGASSAIEEAVSTIVQSVRSASTSARELETCANQLREGATALGGGVAAFLNEVRAA